MHVPFTVLKRFGLFIDYQLIQECLPIQSRYLQVPDRF